jgi:hypothetical protein
MTTATAMLNAARAEVGYREGRNNSNKYGSWYGMPNQPYCAMGLTWCAYKIGAERLIGGKWAYCPYWAEWFRVRKLWHESQYRRGDIAFFDWSGNRRKRHEVHVAIIEEVTDHGVKTVEFNTVPGAGGNQSDGGGVYRRHRSMNLVVGVGRPLWMPEASVQIIATVPAGKSFDRRILVVDGVWGKFTTMRVQQMLGLRVSGAMHPTTVREISTWLGQPPSQVWTKPMKTALQHRVGVPADGIVGPITVRAFQRYLNRRA